MSFRERQVQADLYCVLRNAIELSQQTKGMMKVAGEKGDIEEINNVIIEFPVGHKKADVVVFSNEKPFLVIEVKKRAYTQTGRSLAAARARARERERFHSP